MDWPSSSTIFKVHLARGNAYKFLLLYPYIIHTLVESPDRTVLWGNLSLLVVCIVSAENLSKHWEFSKYHTKQNVVIPSSCWNIFFEITEALNNRFSSTCCLFIEGSELGTLSKLEQSQFAFLLHQISDWWWWSDTARGWICFGWELVSGFRAIWIAPSLSSNAGIHGISALGNIKGQAYCKNSASSNASAICG